MYSGHALDRMQDRGYVPTVIENTIKIGKMRLNKILGRLEYRDAVNNLRVIAGEDGHIITVIPTRSGLRVKL